jgi:hypothetical protein
VLPLWCLISYSYLHYMHILRTPHKYSVRRNPPQRKPLPNHNRRLQRSDVPASRVVRLAQPLCWNKRSVHWEGGWGGFVDRRRSITDCVCRSVQLYEGIIIGMREMRAKRSAYASKTPRVRVSTPRSSSARSHCASCSQAETDVSRRCS